MNTKIYYSYSDANGYGEAASVTCSGTLSEQQKTAFKAALSDGEFFIASQVDLPDPAIKTQEKYGYDPESDHPFSAFIQFEETDELPTDSRTIQELFAAFRAKNGNWQEESEEW